MPQRPGDHQTRPGRGADDPLAYPEVPACPAHPARASGPLARVALEQRGRHFLPAFPAFLRMTSPWYRTPLPLYGSGGRILRMFAATSPTCCLLTPSTLKMVGRSTRKVIPSGAGTSTGCEKPSANSRSVPLAVTRYPVPAISSVFLYPSVTPMIMLATRVRDSPCSSLARRSSLGRSTASVPSSERSAVIGSASVWLSSPLGPLTRTVRPSMVTSTPLGTGIGLRPIRDILVHLSLAT